MSTIVLYIILYLVINSIPALFIAINAEKRKMRSSFWFMIVTVFSVIGIAVYIAAREPIVDEWIEHVNIEIPSAAGKKCPGCGAYINDDDKVCGLCGHSEDEPVL